MIPRTALPTRDCSERRRAGGLLSRFGKGPRFWEFMQRDARLDTDVMNPSVVIMDSCC